MFLFLFVFAFSKEINLSNQAATNLNSDNSDLSICLFDPQDNDPCSSDPNQISVRGNETDQLPDIIAGKNAKNIIFKFFGSSRENPYRLYVECFNNASSKVVGQIGAYGYIEPCIILAQKTGLMDPSSTKISFQSSYITAEEPNTFIFGELDFSMDCSFGEGIKDTEIIADKLTCKYNALEKLKKVTLTNTLIIEGGSFPNNSTDVYFTLGEYKTLQIYLNSYSYEALNLTVGNSVVIFQLVCFHIEQSNTNKVEFIFENSAKAGFNISSLENTDMLKVPNVSINGTKYCDLWINFIGKWGVEKTSNIFKINGVGTLYLNISDIVPVSIEKCCFINVTATDISTGLAGPVHIIGDSFHFPPRDIAFYTTSTVPHEKGRTTFSILNEYNPSKINKIHFWVGDPFLDVTINSLSVSQDESSLIFNYGLSLSELGVSSLTIVKNITSDVSFDRVITIDSFIEKTIEDEASAPILNMQFPILAVHPDVLLQGITFKYNNNERKIHGFTNTVSCLGVLIDNSTISSGYHSLKLYCKTFPSEIPFSVGFYKDGVEASEELVIHNSEAYLFEKIDEYIPKNVHSIEFYFMENLVGDYSLNVSLFTNITNVRISGNSKSINFIPAATKNINYSITGALLTSVSNRNHMEFSADILNLTYTAFSNFSFYIVDNSTNQIDVDSETFRSMLSTKTLDPTTEFQTPIRVRSVNILRFTENGWISQITSNSKGALIKSDIFTNINFIVWGNTQLIIDENVRKIKQVDFDVYPSYSGNPMIYLGQRWIELAYYDDLKLKVHGETFRVVTPHWEIPDIFDSNNYNISFGLPGYEHESIVNITLPLEYEIYTQKMFDFTLVPNEEQRVLYGNNISLIGNTAAIYFYRQFGYLLTHNLLIKESSVTRTNDIIVSQLLKLEPGASIVGNITFKAETRVELQWNIDKTPMIDMQIQSEDLPSLVNIQYSSDDIDIDKYNSQMYGKSYQLMIGQTRCSELLKNVHVTSSISYFNEDSPDYVLGLECNSDQLTLTGLKKINQLSPTPSQSYTLNPTPTPSPKPTHTISFTPEPTFTASPPPSSIPYPTISFTPQPTETIPLTNTPSFNPSSSVSPTSSPKPTDDDDDSDSKKLTTGAIVGIVFGGIALIILIVAIIIVIKKNIPRRDGLKAAPLLETTPVLDTTK